MAYVFKPRSPLRRLQFSLRGLLMLMLAALTWLGFYADQVHRQRVARAAIRALGGQAAEGVNRSAADEQRLARWLGWDGVYTVNVVHLGGCRLVDDDLACLAGLTHLETLVLTSTPVSDSGLIHLAHLKHLKFLDLRFTHVTPEGVERLRRDFPSTKIVRRSDID